MNATGSDGTAARKLEIFVGATKKDLGHARQAVIDAILQCGHIPSGMELWAAGSRPPLDKIARHLKRCDAHILLVGARYGALVDGPEEISFTEWEYRQSNGVRPVLPFVFDIDSLEAARSAEKDKREKQEDVREKLDRLRSELLKTRYVKEFSNDRKRLGELQKNAILAIDELLQSGDSGGIDENAGWIRGDSDEAKTVRAIVSNRFLRRELEQLRKFSKLGQRVSLDVGSKEAMARIFWRDMQGRIRRNSLFHLFFESGSTVAYLADEFERTMLVADEGVHRWQIRTNNVLSVVQFTLHTPIDASRFPTGIPDPDDPYGAIFPNEWRQLYEPPPKRPRNLHDGEHAAVDTMRKRLYGDAGKHQLVLAAASGLDLLNNEQHFRGPHVASHPNMLFKRAVFTSGSPVVLFISAEKLGDPFDVGRCYPVFDSNEAWTQVIRDYPLAICIGYEQPKISKTASRISRDQIEQRNSPEVIRRTLDGLGFCEEYFDGSLLPPPIPDLAGVGAIMHGNKAFEACIPAG